jgi:hypothetical protein
MHKHGAFSSPAFFRPLIVLLSAAGCFHAFPEATADNFTVFYREPDKMREKNA